MIEFKAECGHTVRAKESDAGGAVRCSYCGRTTAVPEVSGGSLDYLFSEVQTASPPEKPGRFRRSKRATPAGRQKPGQVDPFSIVLRLCYFAVLIIVVVVVGRKFVLPLFNPEERAERLASEPKEPPSASSAQSDASPRRKSRGLLVDDKEMGLYVGSTPKGATVYAVAESAAPSYGRVHRLAGAHTIQSDGWLPRLVDGSYVVEVALPWNDPGLNDPSLGNHAQYLAFRKSIERASDAQRKQLQDEYFLPDEAASAFIAESDDQIFYVRQYRGVVVQQGRSKGVRALFLPKLGKGERRAFSIEALLAGYLPSAKAYGFEESYVRGELNFYGVPAPDQQAILEILSRIGAISYVTPDGRLRMFKIDIHDGSFAAKVLREASP